MKLTFEVDTTSTHSITTAYNIMALLSANEPKAQVIDKPKLVPKAKAKAKPAAKKAVAPKEPEAKPRAKEKPKVEPEVVEDEVVEDDIPFEVADAPTVEDTQLVLGKMAEKYEPVMIIAGIKHYGEGRLTDLSDADRTELFHTIQKLEVLLDGDQSLLESHAPDELYRLALGN